MSHYRELEGFLGLRYFLVAGVAVCQLSGIPIEGPLSGVTLHLVSSSLEFKFDQKHKTRNVYDMYMVLLF